MISPSLPLVKFEELLLMKVEFDRLLEEFGIKQTNNRFDQCEAIIKKALSVENPKDTGSLRHSITELSDTEAILELRKVGILSDENLRRILPIIVSGHLTKIGRHSDKPDHSRNVMFEMALLNFLHLRGYRVRYEDGNDVILKHNDQDISIECKRLRVVSDSSIKSNLRKAYHQLEKTRKDHSIGVVALGIEEYIFGKDELLLVESGEYAEQALAEFNRSFINKHGKWWQLRGLIKDPLFCPAVFICIKATVYDFKNNITGTGFFLTTNNTSYPPSQTFEKIKFLGDEATGWTR